MASGPPGGSPPPDGRVTEGGLGEAGGMVVLADGRVGVLGVVWFRALHVIRYGTYTSYGYVKDVSVRTVQRFQNMRRTKTYSYDQIRKLTY